jgi:hypothetical protein
MASRLQLALRDTIAEALFAASSGGAGIPDEILVRLVHDAETGNLPDDPRDWFREQLEYELPNPGPQAAAKRQLLDRSAQLVAAARLGPADIAAMLSRADAPEPASSADIAQLAARCLTVAMDHQRSIGAINGGISRRRLRCASLASRNSFLYGAQPASIAMEAQ